MFQITDQTINPTEFLSEIPESCGGVVTFEGRVRNHHEGREVSSLEYSAHPTLAEKEGLKIFAEAQVQFPELTHAEAIHRTGPLAIGEIAVLVVTASSHRAEAFAACRWLIDEIKHRVPIWKLEHYPDGSSDWTGCQRCHKHHHQA
ncbi:MAG: molybdenum cofactor biosynthesis protein MoaE [Verrucomicrobiota bacterium]